MSAQELRELIDSLTTDIEFTYDGKRGAICPFNRQNICVTYDGSDIELSSIDDAMSEPFIDGKSLNEISELLDIG